MTFQDTKVLLAGLMIGIALLLGMSDPVHGNDNSSNRIIYPQRETAGPNPLIISEWSGRPTGLEVRILDLTAGTVLQDWVGVGDAAVEFRTKDILGYDLPLGHQIRVRTRPRTTAQDWPVASIEFVVDYEQTSISHTIGTEFRSRTSTYLRTNQEQLGPTLIAPDDQYAPAVMGFRLSNYGIHPGDCISITSDLDYEINAAGTAHGDNLVAVFSSSSKILTDPNVLNRVPGAIDAGNDFFTPPTHFGELQTDIPEDFLVTREGVLVEVPANAEYIFLSHLDTYFSDNRTGHATIGLRLLGDVNRNGVVDFFDIPQFIAILQAGGFQYEADMDRSGKVDFLDIAAFTEILSSQ